MKTNFKNVTFENGANQDTAETILTGIKKDISSREKEILKNLGSVEQNREVPAGYVIYSFYDRTGNGFEAGKTPAGYSITN